MDKKALLEMIILELSKEMELVHKAALEAKEATTSEESKAEHEYDTRSIEAGYLAAGQAQRAQEISDGIQQLQKLKLENFDEDTEIGVGALIKLEDEEGEEKNFFLIPNHGGIKIQNKGIEIQTLTPEAPIGKALIQKNEGDMIEVTIKGNLKSYQITEVS